MGDQNQPTNFLLTKSQIREYHVAVQAPARDDFVKLLAGAYPDFGRTMVKNTFIIKCDKTGEELVDELMSLLARLC